MPEQQKGRRVSIDLTAPAAAEVDRLRNITGLTTADLFRNALALLHVYLTAKQNGQQVAVVDARQPNKLSHIELPIFVGNPSPAMLPEAEQEKKVPANG